MARAPSKSADKTEAKKTGGEAAGDVASLAIDAAPPAAPVGDAEHPDYIEGLYSDRGLTPVPDGPLPPLPGPFPAGPFPGPLPGPLPGPFPPIHPEIPDWPLAPLNYCGPVSGRYRFAPPVLAPPGAAANPIPGPIVSPIFTRTTFIVRVDVDRYYPQRRISIEASRIFPGQRAHAIAEVTSDQCTAHFQRRVEANITYRDGVASLIPGVRLIFEARRTTAAILLRQLHADADPGQRHPPNLSAGVPLALLRRRRVRGRPGLQCDPGGDLLFHQHLTPTVRRACRRRSSTLRPCSIAPGSG